MRYAIVSDIHANMQAWEAVRKDIAQVGVDATLCLGDVIGYGPRPGEVLESVWEHCDEIVLGNHDAVIGGRLDPDIFSQDAQRMIAWTQEMLEPSVKHFLAELPAAVDGDTFTMTHAELFDPERYGYIETPEEIAENFGSFEKPILFVGHSHDPRIFVMDETSGAFGELPVEQFVPETGYRYIVNVGSVGDPRDGRTVGSYCVYDEAEKRVSHRSVAFDLEAYRADLDEFCVPIKPWFLMCWDHQVAGAKHMDEWSIDVRKVVRPRKRIVIRHVRPTEEEGEQARLEAAREAARRQEIVQSMREAREVRLEREARRGKDAEAVREALAARRVAAAAARELREAEEHQQQQQALARKRERLDELARQTEARKKQEEAKATALAERIREQQKAAAEAKRLQAEKAAKDEARKQELLRQRKIELAQAAEQRAQEARTARTQTRDAERERIRKQIERKRQLAARKKHKRPDGNG